MKSLKIFFLILLCITPTFSQTIEWANRYDYNHKADNPFKIHTDGNSNVYVVGISQANNQLSGYTTIKYNSSGGIEWIKNYFPPNVTQNCPSGAYGVETDASGNVYVTGEMCYGPNPNDYDVLTLKYDPNGILLWFNRWDAGDNLLEFGRDLVINNDGYVFVCALVAQPDFSVKAGILKIDPNNINPVQALKFYPTINDNWCDPRHITIDGQGNVFVVGPTYTPSPFIFVSGNYNYFTAKVNSNNELVYSESYDGIANGYDLPYSIYVNSSGDAFVTGASTSSNGYSDIATIKYSPSGTQIWVAIYNNGEYNHDDVGYSVKGDNQGNILLCGSSRLSNWAKSLIIKYDQNGNVIWENFVNTRGFNPSESSGLSLAIDNSNNIYSMGYIRESPSDNYDFLIYKLSPSGQQLWRQTYDYEGLTDGTLSGGISGRRIVLDPSNNVYVTGISQSTIGGDDIATLKINQNQDNDLFISNQSFEYKLDNFPNPFNPNTYISFSLPKETNVKLEVFDITGKNVATLVNDTKPAGNYKYDFNASELSSGIYFYKLTARQAGSSTGSFVSTKKMILAK